MLPHKKLASGATAAGATATAGGGHHLKTMDLSMGAHRLHHKKVLNLNIYSSREIEKTKYDENYQKRVEMKDLIFFM